MAATDDGDQADQADKPVERREQSQDRFVEVTGRRERPQRDSGDRDSAPVEYGPRLPEGADYSALDVEARAGLRSLPKSLAELVGKHLVAAGMLVDDDPERALEHARFARERAARVAVVREAAGLTAYHAGEWAEALSELRAVRRMSGGNTYIAVMADCERALGRPERALELAKEAGRDLPADVAVELRIVSAGARRDMGQLEAAVVSLQGPDLDPKRRDPWSARLFYAYADNLAAADRTEEAIQWFLNAAQADDDEDTDAAERAFELGADESEIAAALPGETVEVDESAEDAAAEDNADDADESEVDDEDDLVDSDDTADDHPVADDNAAVDDNSTVVDNAAVSENAAADNAAAVDKGEDNPGEAKSAVGDKSGKDAVDG
ncbi:hypothetical protein [Actinokineospora terrae]|uniref:Tetratricopeptide repeat-containing protein n=1 Tax=Actinokineospora terrae TaxID=155974 RepID=A0A1H9KYJ4_9PSEU|nr:hypothetical protein [Actinokineospora terrae]SER04069.1 hypothetical protein SAMN04487818_101371 [Actinokineospora terrae]